MQLITVTELKDRLLKGEKINLVDVREISEHNEFNIGGILIPLGKIQAMDISELEAFERSGTYLLLPQRKPKRSGMPDPGYAGFHSILKICREECLPGKKQIKCGK